MPKKYLYNTEKNAYVEITDENKSLVKEKYAANPSIYKIYETEEPPVEEQEGGEPVNFTEGSGEQQEQPTEPLKKDITIEDGTIKTPEMDFNAQALLDKKLSEKYSGPKLTFAEAEPFVEEPIDISIPEKKDIVKGKIYTPPQLISDREAEILELSEKIKTLPQPQVGRMGGYPTKQEIDAYEERKELIKLKNQKEKQLADLKNSNDDILSAESGSSYFLDGEELTRSQLRNFATGMEFTTGLESGDKDFDIKVENDEQMDDFLLSQKEAADVGFFEKSARGFASTTKDILIDGIDVKFAESQQLLADIGLIDEEAAAMATVLGSYQPGSASKAFALAKMEVARDPREKKDFGDAFLRNFSAQIQNTNEELRGKQLERSYDVIDLLEAGEIGAGSKEIAKMSVESLPYTFVAMTGWGGSALIANSVQAREYYDLRNQGVSKERALISSGLAALIETADAALEAKIFKSNISKARKITNQTGMAVGYTKQQLKDLSKNVFSSYVKEMPTELAQGTLGELNRQWATDKPIDFEAATRAGVIESLAAAPTSTIISSPAMAKLVYAPVKRYKDLSKIQNTIGDFLFRSAETTDNTERKILLDQSKMLVNDFIAESNKIEQTAKKATEEESNTLKDLTLQEFTLERTLENTDNLSPETVEVLQSKLDDIGKQKSELINNIDSREDITAPEEVIEEQEYTKFVDDGVVSEERIQDIADKVRQQQELTPREQEIFTDKTSEVNQKIAEFTPTEEVSETVETISPLSERLKNVRVARVGGTFNKGARGEAINEKEIEEAQSVLMDELNEIEKSNLPQEQKDAASAEVEKLFNELENYELTTETKTRQITQKRPTRVVREGVKEQTKSPQERSVGRKINRVEGTEFTQEGFVPQEGETTVLEEQEGKIVLQDFDKDGNRTTAQELGVESVNDLELVETLKDDDGKVIGATVRNKNNDAEVFSIMDEELALDYAIEKTKAEVGEMSIEEESVFEEYEEVKKRPTKKKPTKEVVKEEVTEKVEPTKPITEETLTEEETSALDDILGFSGQKKRVYTDNKSESDKKRLKRVNDALDKIEDSFQKIFPNLYIGVAEDSNMFARFAKEQNTSKESRSRGVFTPINVEGEPKRYGIILNPDFANVTTAFHEAFHALMKVNGFNNEQARAVTSRMIKSVQKGATPELNENLETFVSQYETPEQSEEYMAELFGILSYNYSKQSGTVKGIIKRWLRKLAEILGLKPKNTLLSSVGLSDSDAATVKMLNVLADKMSRGKVLSKEDVTALRMGGPLTSQQVVADMRMDEEQEGIKKQMPQSASKVLYNDSDVLPKPSKKKSNSQVAQDLAEVAAEYYGGNIITSNTITAKQEEEIIQVGTEEAIKAFEDSGKSAADWYSTAIEKAMAVAAVIHPSLSSKEEANKYDIFNKEKDPVKAANLAMRIALAITSQNLNVEANAKYANEQFDILKKTGKFDASREYGTKATSISSNLRLANELINKIGLNQSENFITKDFNTAELEEAASEALGKKVKISGLRNDLVNGAALFGPKIGQGFLQNLMGKFEPVTIDLWLRRTWGRWTGDVVGVGVTEERMARLLNGISEAKKDTGFDIPDFMRKHKVIKKTRPSSGSSYSTMSDSFTNELEDNDEFRNDISIFAKALTAKANTMYKLIKNEPMSKELYRDFMSGKKTYGQTANELQLIKDKTSDKYKDYASKEKAKGLTPIKKSEWVNTQNKKEGRDVFPNNKAISSRKPEWVKASTTIINDLKPIDIPSNQDRKVITRVVKEIKNRMEKQGYSVTNADVQALLWYPEKDIWSKLRGEEESNLKQSYDEQFIKIAEKQGLGKEAQAAAEGIKSRRTTQLGGTDGRTTDVKVSRPVAKKETESIKKSKRTAKDLKNNWTPTPIKSMRDSEIAKSKEVMQRAAIKLLKGEITQKKWVEVREKHSPINKIGKLFQASTLEHMNTALGKKADKLMAPVSKDIRNRVGARLDIPSYLDHNAWVVTLHDGKGPVISYRNAVRLKDVEFVTDPNMALMIASGQKPKSTFARMIGELVDIPGKTAEEQGLEAQFMIEDIMNNKEWTQVGMNPFRQSWFWNRENGKPVVAADEVIQVGGLVYAKNITEAEPGDKRFEVKGRLEPTTKDGKTSYKLNLRDFPDERITDPEGETIKFSRRQPEKNKKLKEAIEFAKDNNLSPKKLNNYLLSKGYTQEEIDEATPVESKPKESIKKLINKVSRLTDNNEARAIVAKELRELLKDSKLSQFSKRTINKVITSLKNTNVSNMQKMLDKVDDAISNDEGRAERIKRYKNRSIAIKRIAKIGPLKELQDPFIRMMGIDPKYLSKEAQKEYDSVLSDILNINKKYDKTSRDTFKTKIDLVLDSYDIDSVRAKEIADRINELIDPTKTLNTNLSRLEKDKKITKEERELITRFKSLLDESSVADPMAGYTEEEIEEYKGMLEAEKREGIEEDFIETLSQPQSAFYSADDAGAFKLSEEERNYVKEANSITLKDIQELSLRDAKSVVRALEAMKAGFLTPELFQGVIKVRGVRGNMSIPLNEIKQTGVVDKISSKISSSILNIGRKKKITGIGDRLRSAPIKNYEQVLKTEKELLSDGSKRFKGTNIYKSLFKPSSTAFSKSEQTLNRIEDKLKNATALLSRNQNERFIQKAKIMVFQIQREYDSNVGNKNKEVNQAKDWINATIKDKDTALDERDIRELEKIRDSYLTDGQVDAKKLYDSLTANEKKALEIIDGVYDELTSMARMDAAVQGMPFIHRENYIHLPKSGTKTSEISNDLDSLFDSFMNASVKNKAAIQRTGKTHSISFDPVSNAYAAARKISVGYHMYPVIKSTRIAFSGLKNRAETRFEKDLVNELESIYDRIINSQYKNVTKNKILADNIIRYLTKAGYFSQLSGVVKAASELGSNTIHAVMNHAGSFVDGYATLVSLDTKTIDKALENTDTTQMDRLTKTAKFDNKDIEGKLLSKAKLFNPEQMTGELAASAKTVGKVAAMPFQAVFKFNESLITKPDEMVIRPLFVGEFQNKFKQLTGQKLNWEKLANDESYRDRFQEAINQASEQADSAVIDTSASTNPFDTIPSNISDPDASNIKKAFQVINRYMTNFRVFEYYSAVKGVQNLLGKGEISRGAGAMLLASTIMRMSIYRLGIDYAFGLIFSALGMGEDEDEIKKEDLTRSVLSGIVTLAFGRNLGNLTQSVVNFGIEYANMKFGEGITWDSVTKDGEKTEYDPYKDSMVFSKIPVKRSPGRDLVADFVISSAGPLTPTIKSVDRAGTLIDRSIYNETKESRDKNKNELFFKTPFDIAGSLGFIPDYKGLKRINDRYWFGGNRDTEKKTNGKILGRTRTQSSRSSSTGRKANRSNRIR